jgi:hypothetical protein
VSARDANGANRERRGNASGARSGEQKHHKKKEGPREGTCNKNDIFLVLNTKPLKKEEPECVNGSALLFTVDM